tara:strand:- start:353 stop:502 length:150 start_codon:yes stop_codon:yes gene_type:complete
VNETKQFRAAVTGITVDPKLMSGAGTGINGKGGAGALHTSGKAMFKAIP